MLNLQILDEYIDIEYYILKNKEYKDVILNLFEISKYIL